MASLVRSLAKHTLQFEESRGVSIRSVLVLEDHPVLAHLLDCAFVLGGYRVTMVANAEAALLSIDSALYAGILPGVLLFDLDVHLEMDRDVFLDRLRKRWCLTSGTHPPLIFLKALVTDLEGITYPVIQKPFHVHALLELCANTANSSLLRAG